MPDCISHIQNTFAAKECHYASGNCENYRAFLGANYCNLTVDSLQVVVMLWDKIILWLGNEIKAS